MSITTNIPPMDGGNQESPSPMSKHRVNLHVYANDADGKTVYHVKHIGFFSASVAAAIAKDIDAGGLAFHSGIENQTGHVDVVTYDMKIQPFDDRAECLERVVNYGPPERQTAAMALRDLLKCAELNQDDLEPETVELIEAAELVLGR
jgi:hypothetical protein